MQPVLRRYVLCKDYPLESRFKVWSKYCDNEHRSFVVGRGEFGFVGNMVRNLVPNDHDRYRTYTWEDFLGFVEEGLEDGDSWTDTMTLDQFKESPIETNFGSFYNDW